MADPHNLTSIVGAAGGAIPHFHFYGDGPKVADPRILAPIVVSERGPNLIISLRSGWLRSG